MTLLVQTHDLFPNLLFRSNPKDWKVSFQPFPVSSTMFEQLFDWDLLVDKCAEFNILKANKKWVVQNLTNMKGDIQPSFSDMEWKSFILLNMGNIVSWYPKHLHKTRFCFIWHSGRWRCCSFSLKTKHYTGSMSARTHCLWNHCLVLFTIKKFIATKWM